MSERLKTNGDLFEILFVVRKFFSHLFSTKSDIFLPVTQIVFCTVYKYSFLDLLLPENEVLINACEADIYLDFESSLFVRTGHRIKKTQLEKSCVYKVAKK